MRKYLPLALIGVFVLIAAYGLLTSIQANKPQTVRSVDHSLSLAEDAGFDCSGAKDYYWSEDFSGYFEYQVDDGNVIVLVCQTFAYQNNYLGIYTTGNDYEILTFAIHDDSEENGWQTTEVPIGLSYDPESKLFTRHEKSRGLGDCGFVATYDFNEINKTEDFLEWEYTECTNIYE